MNQNQIPVLMYHKITPHREVGVTTLHPKKFEKQMQWLFDNSYETVSSHHLTGEKKVIITFDDAYENIFKFALPILKKFNFTATVYPITQYIGKLNSWDANLMGIKFKHMNLIQLKTLVKEGWEIGAHSLSHNVEKIKLNTHSEINDCKDKLEKLLSIKVDSFSYPFGYSNPTILREVEKTYFTAFDASVNRKNHIHNRSRIPVYSFDTLNSFKRKIKFNKVDLKLSNMIHNASYATIVYQNLKYNMMEGRK